MNNTNWRLRAAAAAAALVLSPLAMAGVNTLEGWALMPANTFADGPTSGQFAGAGNGGNALPLVNLQPVQGFSAVLRGAVAGSYLFMPDNGFGTQGNSADALLRMYGVRPDFRTALGGSGTVSAASIATGATLPSFGAGSQLTLADPDRKLGFTVQADYTHYYNNPANALVDARIRSGRLLTGADFDIESMRRDKNGHLWFGEEFGPFLVKTDATGKVLRSEVSMPGVKAPQNPLPGGTVNLNSSNGFEGMAINPAGDRLFTLLEGTVAGDDATRKTLRINEFSIDSEAYTGAQWKYRLDTLGTNIGDMTAINDHEFLVIERNGGTATSGTPFKKIFRIDLNAVDAAGYVGKTEVVDLMNLADPHDLNGDGSATFTFPFVTIESVLILDAHTLLVANDNNYPGTGGRGAFSDNTEFLKISLAEPLAVAVPEPATTALMLAGLAGLGALVRRRRPG